MNDALQLMWADIYEMKRNEKIIERTWNWLNTLSTCGALPCTWATPIYAIKEFRAKAYDCMDSTIFYNLDKSCEWCWCGSKEYKWVYMYQQSWPTLENCQYHYCIDWYTIDAMFPDTISEWYVVYYGWPKYLTLQTDYIPLPFSYLPALKMLINVFYYSTAWAMYQDDDNKFEAKYEKLINKLKERDATKIKFIKNWEKMF